ncbi:MAG: UDP-3-O-(3-hydroxymyristoyl)glucosamine N-acyltransferase [Gammaproteobacteria bacterium]|nr:UDP-3-O-(3-hydroxymyristoyl)glucosamine N-acyltransferase [Gammaproteobacteria bacterium]
MDRRKTPIRLAELADRFKLEIIGNGDQLISGVGTLGGAGPEQLSFLSNRSYRRLLKGTKAGAVVLGRDDSAHCPVNCLVSDNPYVSYSKIAELFAWRRPFKPGIHPSACVAESAKIGPDAAIGPQVIVEEDVEIGAGCEIGAGTFIGAGSVIGASCVLAANVTLCDHVTLGERVLIHPGAVIGADGFGLAFDKDHWQKVPQIGNVVIGDDCEIGANTAIDRGAIEDTRLGNDVRVDNLVQIGHNVIIGDHTAIAGCTGIAGSTRIGNNCLLGGGVGILGHIEIVDNVTISGMSAVNRSVTEEGSVWASAVPARPLREWQRNQTHLRKLDQIVNRIRELESNAENSKENE